MFVSIWSWHYSPCTAGRGGTWQGPQVVDPGTWRNISMLMIWGAGDPPDWALIAVSIQSAALGSFEGLRIRICRWKVVWRSTSQVVGWQLFRSKCRALLFPQPGVSTVHLRRKSWVKVFSIRQAAPPAVLQPADPQVSPQNLHHGHGQARKLDGCIAGHSPQGDLKEFIVYIV